MFIIDIILICWLLTHYFLSLKWKNKNKTTTPARLDLMCIIAEISGALVKIFRGRGRKANMGGANFGHKML